MSPSPMINLYALLNLGPYVDAPSIEAAIGKNRQTGSINAAILDKAEQWLLNPAIRNRYDAQLKQQQPEFFLATPATDTWKLDDGEDEVRLGVLEEKKADGVHLETATQFDNLVYIHEQNRYNLLTKTIIYGGIAMAILGIVLAIAWPMLKKTVFATSDWDKQQYLQQFVQKGWQEDAEMGEVYLESEEYTSRLAIKFKDNDAMAVLTNTSCDMSEKGLCQVRIQIDGQALGNDEHVGVGLMDDMPLATRADRENTLKRLQAAKNIKVSYTSRGEAITQTFQVP